MNALQLLVGLSGILGLAIVVFWWNVEKPFSGKKAQYLDAVLIVLGVPILLLSTLFLSSLLSPYGVVDRSSLWVAQVFYSASCIVTLWRLRAGGASDVMHWVNLVAMLCGFAWHTAFLVARGLAIHHCPLTNLFETQAFIAWAAVLFCLLIGPSYRVSFLGAFTAPLVLLICLVALLAPVDVVRAEPLSRSPWVEFHAAVAIIAYGAFALAFVTAAMYLFQERQLKTRHLTSSFLLLPSIEQLDVIHFRLLIMGFGMLTAGMVGGIISYHIVGHWTVPKIIWAWSVWVLYGALVVSRGLWALRGRKVAVASMVSFTLMLVGFWGVNLFQR